MPSSPIRDQSEMSADRRHGKRKPLDQSTRTDQQRLNPHINAISGESSRFCNETFNAWSRLLLRDVKNLQVGMACRRDSNVFAISRLARARDERRISIRFG
jgi:hypothetical protein